ncbi:outer membrane lipoprotein-sorting protein [Myxococcaceae bacterium GXIMD 01537]
MSKALLSPLCAAVLVLALSSPVHAEESAADISRKSRERGALNVLGLLAEVKLTTTGKNGKSKEQVLTTTAKKVEGRTRSLVRFSQPEGVAGVAVLTVEGAAGEASEMSLYLPKFKRVRKMARSQRGSAFMDTDFSYADLGGTGGEGDASLKKVGETKVMDRLAWVLRGSAGPDSPYGQVTVYVDQQTYVPTKVEYTDKEGKPLKVYRASSLKTFKDRVIAARADMENLQTGSHTVIEVLKLEEATLGDEAFSERALERG